MDKIHLVAPGKSKRTARWQGTWDVPVFRCSATPSMSYASGVRHSLRRRLAGRWDC